MFGFFDSFSRGCGCAVGTVIGLAVVVIIVILLFGTCGVEVG